MAGTVPNLHRQRDQLLQFASLFSGCRTKPASEQEKFAVKAHRSNWTLISVKAVEASPEFQVQKQYADGNEGQDLGECIYPVQH